MTTARPTLIVREYSAEALADLLVEASVRGTEQTDNRFVRRKPHLRYLQEYLGSLSCASIVVEHNYIDRDFLEDFAAYHVRSFHPYQRYCTRLHFFSKPWTQSNLEAAILRVDGGATPQALQATYLGFAVLRPLPLTVLGRTCLKTYPQKRGYERRYPTTYRQHVDLYGIPLSIDTVAFQEQDRDVAACATSALWSVLQCTGRSFQHAIPSPVAITATAGATGEYDERMLPAVAGLTIRQIANALRYVGLEPHLIPLEAHSEEKSDTGAEAVAPDARIIRTRLEMKIAIAAYLRAGIPCLLLVRVTESGGVQPDRQANHAVAVTGYRYAHGPTAEYGESRVRFDASRMDKLFVHDDQVGPFARMRFADDGGLTISWPDQGAHRELRARSHTLLVPLNHKIRIPFGTVLSLTLSIARQLDAALQGIEGDGFDGPITWDVQLSRLDQFRNEIARGALPDDERLRLLARPLPKYIWRISALVNQAKLLELILDATDLMQGDLLVDVVVHDDRARTPFGLLFTNVGVTFDETPAHRRVRQTIAALRRTGELGGSPAANA